MAEKKVDVKIANKSDAEEWDKLVEASPHGTIFHTWKWLKIVEKHTNSKLYPIIGYKGSTPIGVYPLFYQKKSFLKMLFSPPPHTAIPYMGPIFINYNKLKQDKKESYSLEFQREIDSFISSNTSPNYILVNLAPGLLDARPFVWTGYQVMPTYHYQIDLSKGMDKVWKDFKTSLRQHINRAKKRGVTVEEGGKKELLYIYDSLVKRYKQQGKRVRVPRSYLLDLYEEFYPQNLRIFVAKHNNELVGGIVTLFYRDRVSYWIGGAKPDLEGTSPNDLVQWEAMNWSYKHGAKYYEEIGANTERLCKFKARYNPNLVVCFTAEKYYTAIFKLAKSLYLKIRQK